MAVPPGNKQVGQVMVAATYAAAPDISQVTLHNYSMVAVVDDPSRVYTVQRPSNLQLGTVDLQLVSGISNNNVAMQLHQFTMVAVLRYDPPTSINLLQFTTTPVVTDTVQAARPLEPIKNLTIGTVAATVTTKMPDDLVQMAIEQLVVVAVIREFHPRKEHVTMTIEYGAEAKLNVGDSQ